jgi:hypothetical protein
VVSRVFLLDADKALDVFELVELASDVVRVRSAYLFEIGEELALRIERDGAVTDTRARVRAHVGAANDRVTELELGEAR